MMNVNILEGLRFYVSFACTFAFGELKLMEGSAKILSLIARDESLHLLITQRILNNYRELEHDKTMNKVMRDSEKEVYKMYEHGVGQEKRWATYLFSKGSNSLFSQYKTYLGQQHLRLSSSLLPMLIVST